MGFLRISGGQAGGRRIVTPPGSLRPTQDKVRQALFSSLGDAIVDARFLDLFAGSGSVGLEAWSRGAKYVCWVEQDRRATETLKANVATLAVPQEVARVVGAPVLRYLAAPGDQPYSFIYADPPYDEAGEILLNVATGIEDANLLAPRGLFIFEQGEDDRPRDLPGWTTLQDRRYGASRLVFYARNAITNNE